MVQSKRSYTLDSYFFQRNSDMDPLSSNGDGLGLVVLLWVIMILFALLLVAALIGPLAMTWLRAYLFGIPLSVVQILAMRWRGVPPGLIVDSVITLIQRGYRYDQLMYYQAESLYLTQREEIRSPEQLADLTAKFIKSDGPG